MGVNTGLKGFGGLFLKLNKRLSHKLDEQSCFCSTSYKFCAEFCGDSDRCRGFQIGAEKSEKIEQIAC